jgi:hypothetical protein
MDNLEKKNFLTLPGVELGRPARSQSLYRLRYSGFYNVGSADENK